MLHKSLNLGADFWRSYIREIWHSAQLITATCLCLSGNELSWVSTWSQTTASHLASALSMCLYLRYVLFTDGIFSSSSNPAFITLLSHTPFSAWHIFLIEFSCYVMVSHQCMLKWLLLTDYLILPPAVFSLPELGISTETFWT